MKHSNYHHDGAMKAVVFLDENGDYKITKFNALPYDSNQVRQVEDRIIDIVLSRQYFLLRSDFETSIMDFVSTIAKVHRREGNDYSPLIGTLMEKRGASVIVHEMEGEEVAGTTMIAQTKGETLDHTVKRAIRQVIMKGSDYHEPKYIDRDFEEILLKCEPEDIQGLIDKQPPSGNFLLNIMLLEGYEKTPNDYSLMTRKIASDLKLQENKEYMVVSVPSEEPEENDHIVCDCIQCLMEADGGKYAYIPIFQRYSGGEAKLRKLVEFPLKKYGSAISKMMFYDLEYKQLWIAEASQDARGCRFYDITGAGLSPYRDLRDNDGSAPSIGIGSPAEFKLNPLEIKSRRQ